MAARQPTHQTIAFGAEVTRLREQAGLSRLDLAKLMAVTRSYIGQVEKGTTRARRDFAERLDGIMSSGTTLVDAWDDLLKSSRYPAWFRNYPVAERTAALLRAYETMFVYGLFQTEAYMQALLQDDTAVQARLDRQKILHCPNPPLLCVVLAENTLWTVVGGPSVMKEQCEHLLSISERDHVTLQVAPAAYYRGIEGPFHLATQPNGEDLLHMPAARGGFTSNNQEDLVHIVGAFTGLQARALSADDSREFLRKAGARWT